MSRFRYTLFSLLALLPMLMSAAPIDSVAARELASRFVSSGKAVSLRSTRAPLRLAHVEPSACQHAAYYVFQSAGGSGFVIIAGDDRVRQVLAYGDSPIDTDNVPENVRWLLDQYKEQMEYLFAHPDVQPSTAPVLNETSTVPQMLTTQWGQRTPYRDQCPQVDGKPCVTGCVATSMAQVMNYWKFPSFFPAVPAYTTSTLQLSVPALPATDVAWDLMRDSYNEGTYTEEQGAAVALLMRYCGQACKMDYTIPNSSASPTDQLKALKQFGYNQNAKLIYRNDYSDTEWHAMLLEDLLAQRPVIYGGNSSSQSHNFVLDGYDNGKYHVNWGWDGAFDGYFELDAMNAGGFKPNQGHNMLHGVCPNDEVYNYKVDGIYYSKTGESTVAVTFRNNEFNSYSGKVVIPESIAFNGLTFRVTAITDNAFRNCSQLTSVEIPESITSIGSRAFDHAGITSIDIPNSVTSIGYSCFESCTSLASVVMGNGVKIFSPSVFKNCTRLESIALPESLTSIGDLAFSGCSSLKSISLPTSLVRVNDNAFLNCRRLEAVHIDNLSAWCNIVFTSVNSNPLTHAHHLFIDGLPLNDITLPADIKDLKSYAFCGLVVDRLTINAGSLNSIGINAFYQSEIGRLDIMDVSSWLDVQLSSGESNPIDHTLQVYFDGLDTPGTIVLPKTMTRLRENAFSGCTWLSSITISSNIVEIGANAFADCANLTKVHIEDVAAWCGIAFGNASANPLIATHHLYFGDEPITELTLPETVSDVNAYAFVGIYLDKLTINAGLLHTIGMDAFYQSRISRLDIIDVSAWLNIEFIGSDSNPAVCAQQVFFDGENTPGTVTLPSSMTKINNRAFANCVWLKSIFIPSSIVEIGASAFSGCINLTEVHIEDVAAWCGIAFGNVTANPLTAAKYLYLGDNLVTELAIPSSVSDVAAYAFAYIKLDHMTIDAGGLHTIGTGAFFQSTIGRTDVTDAAAWFSIDFGEDANPLNRAQQRYIDGEELTGDYVLPNNMTRIGARAFSKCPWIRSLTIPSNIVEIGEDAFKWHNIFFKSVTINDLGAWCNIRFANAYSSPFRGIDQVFIDGQDVCVNGLVLPDTVTSISNYAFSWLNVSSLTIPPSVTSIGDGSFRYLSSLNQLEIPSSVLTIGESAFAECGNLTNITFNNGLKVIGDSAFYNCTELTSMALPRSLEQIGNRSFLYCLSLPQVVVPEGVTAIGKGAFSGCSSMESAVLGIGINAIPDELFMWCSRLSNIQMPASVTTIGRAAFYACYNLTSISLPDSLRTIGDFAFSFSELNEVNLSGAVTFVGEAAFGSCNNLTQVIIGDQVTTLSKSMFQNCTKLNTVVIGDGVKQLMDYTFYYCASLKNVTIGSSVDSIMAMVFDSCYDLSTITCKAKNPPVFVSNNYLQDNTYRNGVLYVPMASVGVYKKAFIWQQFAHIVGVCMGHVHGDMNCDEEVNIADVNIIINSILEGENEPDNDVNGDGEVNIADIHAVIDIILQSD